MGSFYHKEDNDLSQALANNTVEDYLYKVGPTRLTSEAFDLIEHNLRIDREQISREELALGFIHQILGAGSNYTVSVVEDAYAMADAVIAER